MTLGTVVVTGVTTFIGCHLAPAFAKAGYTVIAALNTPPAGMDRLHAARWRKAQPDLSASFILDITDPSAVEGLIAAQRPSLWVHLAGIGKDFATPAYDLREAMRVDLMPLDSIYRGMADVGGGVLSAGSSMEYGGAASPHTEDLACFPDMPYGLAKLAATLRARQLALRYGVPTRVARLYTLFGELDSETRLVARLVQRLEAGQPVGVAPGAFRDICDIVDVVDGYLALSQDCRRRSLFDVFNMSRGSATELKDVALLVAAQIGADPALVFEDPSAVRRAEPATICGDSRKAATLLGWTPRPIAEGLSRMISSGMTARESV